MLPFMTTVAHLLAPGAPTSLGGELPRTRVCIPGEAKITRKNRSQTNVNLPWSLPVHAGGSAYSCLAPIGGGKVGLLFERDGDAAVYCTSGSSCQIVFVTFPEDP